MIDPYFWRGRRMHIILRHADRAERRPFRARLESRRPTCTSSEPVVLSAMEGHWPLSRDESTSSEMSADLSRSSALDALYREHRDVVLRYIQRSFGSGPPDPSDVVQAAFEKFVGLDSFADIANPRSFLIASARNCALDQRRRLKVRRDYADEKLAIENDVDDFNPERVLLGKQQWALLDGVINRMDARRREILIMNRINGLSCAETARRLGCSATLVKTLLAQALVLCQRALQEDAR